LNTKDTYTDRLEAQAKAKQALLDKAKKNDPTSDPEFAGRQQARLEAARLREEREAGRRRAVQEERDRVRAERAAIAAAKAAETARKAEETRLAAEQAFKDAEERARRAVRTAPKPVQLGLKDLRAALEARTGGGK
jgi:Family of unknown function (DUF6481)